MMPIALIALIVCQLMCNVDAARRVDAHLRARETLQRRREINTLTRRDAEIFDVNKMFALSKDESMTTVRQVSDALGTCVDRLQEEYLGIPVFDGQVTVRTDKKGQLTGDATGTLVQDIDGDLPDTKAILDDAETLDIAIRAERDEALRSIIGDISYKRWVYLDKNDKARLVNTVSYLIDAVKRPFYVIDVQNGEVLRHWDALNNFSCGKKAYKAYGGNVKSGRLKYGDAPYCLNFTIVGDTCHLENAYVRVVDMQHTTNSSITETASFKCKDGYHDKINGGYSPAIDAFFHGTVVGKMFEDWFDSTPIKEKIVIRVHYNRYLENAYWNGVNCTFGDGFNSYYPLTTLDIIGHEIAHGITEQGSALMYYDECGGVNEAFSDIMGEVAEQYVSTSDLVVGKFAAKHQPFIRDFQDPKKDKHSIRSAKEMTHNLDPHSSSGVYRRIWYVIIQKENMPVPDAARVFLHANRMYWHHAGTFYDCSCGLLRAALDLGYSTSPFRKAFKVVGIKVCELSGHVFHLANNITQPDVTVSDTIHPVFKFQATNWTSSIIIEAKTSSYGVIKITVQTGTWEDNENQRGTIIAEGETKLELQNMAGREVYITLSTDDLDPHYNVEVTAGYTCVVFYEGDKKGDYKRICL